MSAARIAAVLALLALACGSSSGDAPPAAPVADAGADQAVASGALVTLDGSGSADPNGLALSYAWSAPASVTLSSASAQKPTFAAPAIAAGQPHATLTFTLVVSDSSATSAPATVTVTVNPAAPANPPPVARAGPNQSVASGAAVTLDGSGSGDPDGQAIGYGWTQLSGSPVTLSGASAAKPTFTAPTLASGSPPATLVFSLVVSDADASSAASTVSVFVSAAGSAFPPPPGTPGPAAPDPSPPPAGGAGSHRFEMGAYLPAGLYLVDPAAGEPAVVGNVVVSFGSAGGPAPSDAVVTMNGVALRRVPPPANGLLWELDPAGPQPSVGSGGELVLVAIATDPASGKPVQRTLVLPCPKDVAVTATPSPGAALVPSTKVHLASASSVTLNDVANVPVMAGSPPTATLFGYDPATRALAGYGSAVSIAPGPLAVDVPVCQGGSTGSCAAPTAGAYLLDLRWPGPWIQDGQTGGFCGLAKRFFFTK